jgi:superoxide dismutase, Cu-Zn family
MSNCIAYFDSKCSSNVAKLSGFVIFHQCDKDTDTKVIIELSGFQPETTHAIHVHSEGDLSSGCDSACAHYNPENKLHGSYRLYGKNRHVGDLAICNITADKNGNVSISFIDDLVKVIGNNSIVGRSVIIHEKPDDEGRFRDENSERGRESGKTGNAGKRICCAVIGRTNKNYH